MKAQMQTSNSNTRDYW